MIDKALLKLRPNAQWDLNGDEYEGIVWKDTEQTMPTKEEVLAEVEVIKNEYIEKEYQRNRQAAYAPLAEQLDYIYHNGIEAWKTDMINPVKTKYPKGSE